MAADNTANQFVSNLVLDTAMMPELGEREKALRDMFVREYLYDFDHIAAALRCGFLTAFAKEYADKFMSEPYVQQQLRMYSELGFAPGTQEAMNEELNAKRKVFNALMREAHYHGADGKHSARVSALAKLATILGMDKGPDKDQGKGELHRGGVMAVPAIANLNDWEDAAVISQEALVQHART